MVKKVLAIFVLSIFLAHFAGFYVYFFFQLNQIRTEMRALLQTLPADKLEQITLTEDQFEKSKVEEHEIRVNDKMYDIARIEKQDGLLLIYCMHDEAEDNIIAFLDKILSSPLKDKSVPTGVLQFFSLTYLPANWRFLMPEFATDQAFTAYTEIESQHISKKIIPPPKEV
jgi:hypothetical protein